MRFFIFLLLIVFNYAIAEAKNVILVMGDGMGYQHIQCAKRNKPIYFTSLPVEGWIHTKSADSNVTDSAASATAYSCGEKTNNGFLGKLPNNSNCKTIAEEAIEKGYSVGIYSTDSETGASPSAFFAHTSARSDTSEIIQQRKTAQKHMDIFAQKGALADIIDTKLKSLKEKQKPFFAFFEQDHIDKYSHINNYEKMIDSLYDLDNSIYKIISFANQNPDTTVIVLADHETGGLTKDCKYTAQNHTSKDVALYAYGPDAELFQGTQENTDIYKKIHQILFEK